GRDDGPHGCEGHVALCVPHVALLAVVGFGPVGGERHGSEPFGDFINGAGGDDRRDGKHGGPGVGLIYRGGEGGGGVDKEETKAEMHKAVVVVSLEGEAVGDAEAEERLRPVVVRYERI